MATGAKAKAWSAIERRLIDAGLRTTNDQPRKKRKRGVDQVDLPRIEPERFQTYIPQRLADAGPDSVLIRVFSRWIRDPLCRRVVSSQIGSVRQKEALDAPIATTSSSSSSTTSIAAPTATGSLPSIKKRFPSVEDEDFVNYESLKSYVGEMTSTKSSKTLLIDGDRVEIVHKSIGEAFEIRKNDKAKEKAMPRESSDDDATSFEIISESFDEEGIYPPPPRPLLGPFHLKIPPPLPPPPPSVPSNVTCQRCPEDASVCFSCEEEQEEEKSDRFSDFEWKSDSTSQVELSFATESLADESTSGNDAIKDDAAAKWMVERFKNRMDESKQRSKPLSSSNSKNSLSSVKSSDDIDKAPFCAVPLRVLGRGNNPDSNSTLRDDICRLAFVKELVALKAQETQLGGGGGGDFDLGNWFGKSSSSSDWNPFLCVGKVVSLSVDDGLCELKSNSRESKSSDFLVTPRFDLTLEEHLQQTGDSSVENRLLLFLQSLEAVAGLHSRNLAHGSVAEPNFFLDLQKEGDHRLLLSDFSKTAILTEDGKRADSRSLGRLGLRLFDDDVGDEEAVGESFKGESSTDFSVDDVPVLGADAPLEMDILVHLLMSNDADQRITPSTAANMLHLYFWRNELRSSTFKGANETSSLPPSSPTSSSFNLSSQEYQTAKETTFESFESGRGSGDGDKSDVKSDLRRSLFQRASFEDILFADEMWKNSRADLHKYALTGDERHVDLFVEPR